MIYKFTDGQEIELHYKSKGATLFDAYDKKSLKKLSQLTGLTVVKAHDSEYPDTPKGKRVLHIDCIMNAPFEFALMDSRASAQTTVDVIEDEEKPPEIDTHSTRGKTLKQIEREAKAQAEFEKMIADSTELYGNPDENETE